jgi:hypothetical protein
MMIVIKENTHMTHISTVKFEPVTWLDDRTFMFKDGSLKTPVLPGDIVGRKIGFSEAAMATGIAGTKQTVRIIDQYCGEIVRDGHAVSGPYLLCELGFYSDAKGYFH